MKNTIIYTILVFISLSGFSQEVEMMLPSDLKQQTIITEPSTLHKGFFRVGVFSIFQFGDKLFNESNEKIYAPESAWIRSWAYMIIARYGITDRLTAEFFLPYNNNVLNYSVVYYDIGTSTYIDNSWDVEGHGLGDIRLGASYQLLVENISRPSITGTIELTIPTGEKNYTNVRSATDHDLPPGSGAYALSLDLRVRKIKYPFSYSGYITYVYNMEGNKLNYATDTEESKFKDGNILRFGGSFNFHLNDWIAIANEINYFHSGIAEVENIPQEDLLENWVISYETRLVFQIRHVRLAEAVIIPIKGQNIPADPQFAIIIQYTF